MRIKSAYAKYGKIKSSYGMTGAQVAERILQQNGIYDVEVEQVSGTLSDHYDPRSKKVRLSEDNYLFLIGLFFSYPMLMDLGIIFFGAVVLFHLVTLPVEFNASSRALLALKNNGYLMETELSGGKKVLNAAALTYVAAAAMALVNLIRLLVLRGNE